MSGILFKSFSCLFLVLLLQQSVPTAEGTPLSSTNCTLYKNIMAGTEAIRVYMVNKITTIFSLLIIIIIYYYSNYCFY